MKRWILVLVPLLLLGALIGWRVREKTVAAAAQNQMRAARMKAVPMVAVAAAQVRDIVPTFESVGGVEAPFNVKIASKTAGRIDFLQVREGDRVVQGQVLVRIDPSEIEAQVHQQQAAVAEAESRLAQAVLTEAPTNVNVSTQISQQQAAVESAQADFGQVKQNYDAQVAAADAAVTDAQGRVSNADAAIANAQAGIKSAHANLNNATAKYNRINDLYRQGFIAAQDVDDARTAADVQQGALDIAEGQLNAAKSMRASAAAQKDAAQRQAEIVRTKGKADIDAARAKVVQAQAALKYAKANRMQVPAYKQNLQALRDSVTAARAGVRNAQAQLANTVLKSPIDGFVTARYMDPGSVPTIGQPILAVQSARQVWVTVPVPEEVSRSIYLGQPASVRLDALPGRTFASKVTQVNAAADPTSRQFQVRVTVDNPQNLLKPGMFARVIMVTHRTRSATVVPREAVQDTPAGPSVIVVDSANVAKRRPVTLGASDASGIAITRGVQPGERVVVLSAVPLRDGQVVRTGGGRSGGEGQSSRRALAPPGEREPATRGQAGGAAGAAQAAAAHT
jgi:HlyD family secretion protein